MQCACVFVDAESIFKCTMSKLKKNNGKTLYNFGIDDVFFVLFFFIDAHFTPINLYIHNRPQTIHMWQTAVEHTWILTVSCYFYVLFCHSYWISSYLLLTNSITANNSLKTLWIITGACNHTNRRKFPPFIIVIVHISKFTLQSELQQITQGKKSPVTGH